MARVIHFDIAADDLARAIAFYRDALGWDIGKASGPIEYWLARTGDADRPGIDGGIAQREAKWQGITMFVDVPSVDEAARRVINAGGTIVETSKVIPGVGYVVACRDTENNVFAMIQSDVTAGF